MPSPFPGMDPYLEDPAFWSDFHATFITYWCDAIADDLPDHYEARMDERVQVVDLEVAQGNQIGPDVSVTRGETAASEHLRPAGVASLEPVTLPLVILDEPRETYIKILHHPGRELVAVLELLSPSNKTGLGSGAYLDKRHALIYQDVHLVELDLLLRGHRLPLAGPLPPGHYYAFLSRADRRPDCDVYAWTVRDPLPSLPIPLNADYRGPKVTYNLGPSTQDFSLGSLAHCR